MPTYRLDLAYDGACFHGYAKQSEVRTVQGDLEAALFPHTGGAETFVAGRTDKGVHATEQVVSFRCDELDTDQVLWSLNRQLAPEIAARRLSRASDDFHARYSATGRAYRYRINDSTVHDPLSAGTTYTYSESLDVNAMNDAVTHLVGAHNFAAFCRKQEGKATDRLVLWARWRRTDEIIELSIGANAFCHQMVRSIVGTCLEVGRGRISPDSVPQILASGERHRSAGAAPAHALVLVAVAYDYEPLPRPSWAQETS
jgi:tRNA pseudouridine38-40 synthase